MSDYDLPDLPSDDELGITDADREAYDEEPELSPEERKALGLDEPARPSGGKSASGKEPPSGKAPPSGGGEPPKKKKEPRPAEPAGPRSRWRGPVTLLVLVAAAYLSSWYRTIPSPAPANAPDSLFSSARAMAMDVDIAARAHPTGSPANADVRQYVMARLRDMGLDPDVQTATVGRRQLGPGQGSRAHFATVRNVVARIPGTDNTGAILLMAHYDAAGIARGAGDDGAGVVSVLETTRALLAGAPLRNDVIVLLTDGEELGLMGAQAFVDGHPWMADVAVVLNVEMRGGGGPSLMFETGADNGWIVRAMRDAGIPAWSNSVLVEIYRKLPNDTDFTRFREASKQGLNFAAVGRASVYHQTYDKPSNLSEGTLQDHGESLLRMARALGAQDLRQVTAPDVTYLTLPLLGKVVYSNALVLPITAWMLLLAVLILIPTLRGPGRWTGVVAGLVLALASMGLSAVAGWGLMRWLPRYHPEYGALVAGAFHHEGWDVLALAGVAFFFLTTLFGLARRWFRSASLFWGALVVPLVVAVVLTFMAPAAAANYQWPVIAADFAAFALLLAAGRRTTMLSWIIGLALTLVVVAFTMPMVELIWLAFSFGGAALLGAFITLNLVLLLPALSWLREPNAWWAPVASLLFAGICLALGIRAAQPTPDYPAPSTLAWAFDRGTGEALWVTSPADSTGTPYAPAEAWATVRAGTDFGQTRSLADFGYPGNPRVAPGPTPTVAPLQIWVLTDSLDGGTRHLRLAVRSGIGAESMQFRFPTSGTTRLVSVDGKPVPVEGRPEMVEYWGVPDPAVMLDLELPQGSALDMDVVEHLLHPGDLLGADHFLRPPDLAPNVRLRSDQAMIRTPAAALDLQYGPPPFNPVRTDTGPGQMTQPTFGGSLSGPPRADTMRSSVDTTGAALDTMRTVPDTSSAQGGSRTDSVTVPDTAGIR